MPKQLSIDEWLTSLGLIQYKATFADNGVDGSILPFLTADDLKEIGVTAVGHRRRMLEAIAALHSDSDPTAGDAALRSSDRQPDGYVEDIQAERRQLTVVFVDLVGSTELSQSLDPEDMSGLVRRCGRIEVSNR
jgi:class 3 adenylate cyclase